MEFSYSEFLPWVVNWEKLLDFLGRGSGSESEQSSSGLQSKSLPMSSPPSDSASLISWILAKASSKENRFRSPLFVFARKYVSLCVCILLSACRLSVSLCRLRLFVVLFFSAHKEYLHKYARMTKSDEMDQRKRKRKNKRQRRENHLRAKRSIVSYFTAVCVTAAVVGGKMLRSLTRFIRQP